MPGVPRTDTCDLLPDKGASAVGALLAARDSARSDARGAQEIHVHEKTRRRESAS